MKKIVLFFLLMAATASAQELFTELQARVTPDGPPFTFRVLGDPDGASFSAYGIHVIAPDGTSRIEARYTIEAEDGTPIYVVNKGLRVSSDDVRTRLRSGEAVDPAEFYMRAAPVFDAPSGPHRWLTERLFICSLAPMGRTIRIDVYIVT